MPKVKKSFVKRKRHAPYSRKTIAKIAKQAVVRVAETKYKAIASENIQLYHNGGTTGNYAIVTNLLQTSQGTTEESRVGDKVHGRGLSIKLWLANKNDRPNVTYRIMVIATPPDQATSGFPSDFFEGDIGNKIIDHVNTNKYKIMKQKIIQIQGQDTAFDVATDTLREKTKYVHMWLPLKNRRITYSTEGGQRPMLQRDCLSLVVIPYDAYGTLTLDNIASMAYCTRFYFKDI